MFTGIVRGIGQVMRVERLQDLLRYTVKIDSPLISGLQRGASVSVDGVCQTVVSIHGSEVTFEAIPETLRRTTLSTLSPGNRVNIERSARVGDEIGGHLLSGHVYGTVVIESINGHVLTFACNPDWTRYLFSKGFVALNGCSLTLVQVDVNGRFTVHLIPETLAATTFRDKRPGDPVNLEFDAMTQAVVETVERILKKGAPL